MTFIVITLISFVLITVWDVSDAADRRP